MNDDLHEQFRDEVFRDPIAPKVGVLTIIFGTLLGLLLVVATGVWELIKRVRA
jgi:uncharacterized membrane protein